MEEAKSFSFYRSYYEAIKPLPDEQRHAMTDAMLLYAFEGRDTEFSDPLLNMAKSLIWPNIETSVKRSSRNSENRRKNDRKKERKNDRSDDGRTTVKTTERPESIGAERSGAEDYLLSQGKEVSNPTAASDGAAVAGATPPPLPEGFERTGFVCSHAGCNALEIRQADSGQLWCPECDNGALAMMGVVL